MKLAFKKGLSGNEEGDRDIEDLADEDSDEDEEGDMIEETKEEAEEVSKPGFLKRARNTVKAGSRKTVTGIIGTRMTNSEACENFLLFRQSSVSIFEIYSSDTLDNLLFAHLDTFLFAGFR